MWGRRKVSIDWEWKPKIQKQKQRGDNFLCKEDRFRFLVGFFMVPLFYFPYCSPLILSKNLPSFCMCCRHLFIDKVGKKKGEYRLGVEAENSKAKVKG
jgi:hypothetical protein